MQQFIPILTYFHRILLNRLLTTVFNFFHNFVGTDVFRRVELGLHFSKFLSFSRSPNILPFIPRHIIQLHLQKVKIFQILSYPGSGRIFIIINLRISFFRQHLLTFITSNLPHTKLIQNLNFRLLSLNRTGLSLESFRRTTTPTNINLKLLQRR